jgi:hypothetical protein
MRKNGVAWVNNTNHSIGSAERIRKIDSTFGKFF